MNKNNFYSDKHFISSDPKEAIIPILKQLDCNYWQLIGTAFYITTSGLFLTARHVLEDVIHGETQTHPIAAFHFFSGSKYIIRPILRAFLKNNSDVAVGLAANITDKNTGNLFQNKIVTLSRKIIKNGDLICTFAYPETISATKKIIFCAKLYEGEIVEYHPNGRDKVFMKHKCYQTTMNILGGASGGPVFNSSGRVIGINSTGYNINEEPHISYISDINEVFDITVDKVDIPPNYNGQYTIKQLADLGFVVVR